MKRYFKATDGTRTVFRASDTRVYRSACLAPNAIAFSAKPAAPGYCPAVEVTKQEYDRLVALKKFRVEASKLDGSSSRLWEGTSPQDSWVWNKDLPPSKIT